MQNVVTPSQKAHYVTLTTKSCFEEAVVPLYTTVAEGWSWKQRKGRNKVVRERFGELQTKSGEQRHREVKKKKKKASGGVSHSPAACSGNSFGTQRQPGARRTAWGAVPSKCIQVAVWIIPSALLEHRPGKQQQQQQQIWVAGAALYTGIHLSVPSPTANADSLYKVNVGKNIISYNENCMWGQRASY